MPHDYRREGSGRWQDQRSDRSEWNRNQDDRFSPQQDADFNQDRDSDYSYFAESSDSDRQSARDRDRKWSEDAGRGRNQEWRRSETFGRPYSAGSQAQSSNRDRQFGQRIEGGPRRSLEGGGRTAQWNEDRDERGYFGTGSYHGAYSTGPGARASGSFAEEHSYLGSRNPMWRDEPQTWQDDDARSAGSTGSSQIYASSSYGAQSGFDRPYANPRDGSTQRGRGFGQDYREQFAEQRYGRQPAFGYGFTEGASSGTFRGRGPKGYERSDERLREIICERLTDDPRIDASEVHIEVKDKVAKLTGQVPDRRTKYEIEDVVEHCGVKDIDNQVRVRSRNEISPTSGTALGYQASEGSSSNTSASATRSKRN